MMLCQNALSVMHRITGHLQWTLNGLEISILPSYIPYAQCGPDQLVQKKMLIYLSQLYGYQSFTANCLTGSPLCNMFGFTGLRVGCFFFSMMIKIYEMLGF